MVIGYALLGIGVGFSSGLLGIGGGTILVPTLIYLGYDIKMAIGISVMQMIFSSVLGSYINFKSGSLSLHSGIYLGFGSFVGAGLSGFVVDALPHIALMVLFAAILVLSIYKMFTAKIEAKSIPNESKIVLFMIGAIVGLLSISTGTGGAVFLTPILVGFLHWDIKKSVGTTLFFIVFGSLSGFVSLAWHGLMDYHVGLLVGIGSMIGVYFGVKASQRISKAMQRWALLLLYTVMFILTFNKILSEMSI